MPDRIRNPGPVQINMYTAELKFLSKMSMMPYYRGPSRIVWFVIGAVTASWLLKRKDSDSRIFGHCMRLQYQTPPLNPSSVTDDGSFPHSVSNSWSVAVRDIPKVINNIPPAHWGSEQQQLWQQEKEHLANISRKVTDAVRSCLSL